MQIEKTKIKNLFLLTPSVFSDDRGNFFESYNEKDFQSAVGENIDFVQDNQSISRRGVLRGLHLQTGRYSQGKLVRVISGAVIDIAVDLRPNSSTLGEWVAVLLNSRDNKQFWIPEGFAHGFISLEDDTIFSYKTTRYYNPQSELCIHYQDPQLGINWAELSGISENEFLISEKDKQGIDFSECVAKQEY